MEKPKILIVDDEELNRVILGGIFVKEYDILEAANGQEAIKQIENNQDIILILLDVVMPVMNGFAFLEYMHTHNYLDKFPVIMITAEDALDSEEQAYSYGIADVMHKPFYPHIVKRRAHNIIQLSQNQHEMERRLKEQEQAIRAQEKKIREGNEFVIDALGSVVEFRSLETGEHVRRIKYFTRLLLKHFMMAFPQYGMTNQQMDEIVRASALHDIGKIGIPDAILLKPGPARLTAEEFEIMKTHTTIGCDILERFCKDQEQNEFYRYCYEICRWHHERWDGGGYPDHLVGDQIPISAQIVAIADVYDALVSPRVYKSAYANNIAYDMILNGECGQFSPDVLECFKLAKAYFFDAVEVSKMFTFADGV